MPAYTYICDNCSNITEAQHLMDEVLEQCGHCNSTKHLRKMPSTVTIMKHKETMQELAKSIEKPGEVVKQSIEDIKGDVEAEKEKLKQRVWLPPE